MKIPIYYEDIVHVSILPEGQRTFFKLICISSACSAVWPSSHSGLSEEEWMIGRIDGKKKGKCIFTIKATCLISDF